MRNLVKSEFIGTGMGRTRIEYLKSGEVRARIRCRSADHPDGPYHRISLEPGADLSRLADLFLGPNFHPAAKAVLRDRSEAVKKAFASHCSRKNVEEWKQRLEQGAEISLRGTRP